MNREELMNVIRRGPVRIRMNDGQSYDVPNREMIVVSDFTASVLYRSENDGKLHTIHLPLITVSGVEELAVEK